ncbi:Fic family protein [Subtercola boreus]|uniref:Fic family protein n=1 Tax=Subtercola boreus TaxID=120213 RepID=UPI001558D937|nr:Fic family protein [Subtercola boreus]
MAEFLSPYNDTPVDPEDGGAFVPGVSFSSKAELYAAEAQALTDARNQLYAGISSGELTAADLTSPYALIDIHAACYGSIWAWAGMIRSRELSIGVAPENIREALYSELDQLTWQIEHGDEVGLAPEFIAMGAHHHLVKIHPFTDGNGRVTRLYADVLLLAMTGNQIFDWSDKPVYFDALRRADATMNPDELLSIVDVVHLGH